MRSKALLGGMVLGALTLVLILIIFSALNPQHFGVFEFKNTTMLWGTIIFILLVNIVTITFSFLAWNKASGDRVINLVENLLGGGKNEEQEIKYYSPSPIDRLDRKLQDREYLLNLRNQILDKDVYERVGDHLHHLIALDNELRNCQKLNEKNRLQDNINTIAKIIKEEVRMNLKKQTSDYIEKRKKERRTGRR